MSTADSTVRLTAFLGAALVLVMPHKALAVTLSTQVTAIHQVGVGAGVSLGHAAVASTNYNRLTAGGTYTATCASSLMLPTSGARTLSREGVIGGLSLVTTVPAVVPTIVNMPGYNRLPAGTVVDCTYSWTSKATEASYSVGPGGIGFTTGAGERADGDTQLFVMIVPPSSGDGDDTQSCHP